MWKTHCCDDNCGQLRGKEQSLGKAHHFGVSGDFRDKEVDIAL